MIIGKRFYPFELKYKRMSERLKIYHATSLCLRCNHKLEEAKSSEEMRLNMDYGLIGEKLGHSYSKIIHEQLTDYQYEIHPLSKEEFPLFMEKKNFKAINVTIPYKCDVIPYLDVIDEKAKKIGAVNTIVNDNGKLTGYNTDYDGFYYTLVKSQINVKGKKVLVLGNGGAALAVLAVLKTLGARQIIIVKYKEEADCITYQQAKEQHFDASIIVNTTPVGMYPNCDISPIDLTPYQNLEAVVDVIYNPLTTKLLAEASERNIKAVNGLWMLVAQAKYAVEHFKDCKLSDDLIDPIYQKVEALLKK